MRKGLELLQDKAGEGHGAPRLALQKLSLLKEQATLSKPLLLEVPSGGPGSSPLMGRTSRWAWGMLHNLLGVLRVQH